MSMIRNCGIIVLVIAGFFGLVVLISDMSPTTKNSGVAVSTEDWERTKQENQEKQAKKEKERQEKIDFLYNFIESANKKYDQAEQVTWVDSVGTTPLGHKGIYTYMGIKGKPESGGRKWLRAIIHYSAGDWVFFNRVTFSNTEESWTYHLSSSDLYQNKKETVVMGGIHEILDLPFDKIERGLRILASGENPRIDFLGEYRATKQVTAAEIENIKTYIKLQEAINELGGSKSY